MRTPAPRTTRSGAVARAADRFVIGDIRAVEKARCRERGVAQRRAAADNMLICPAEKRMTKHHVPVQISDTRDRSRYRYVGENDTMREIRAGAARRPGTIVRVWRHSRGCSLASPAAAPLAPDRQNTKQKTLLRSKKRASSTISNDGNENTCERGSGCGQGRACAVCALLVLANDKRSRVQTLAQPVRSFGSLGAANVTWCTTANQDAASTNASHRPKCSAGRAAGTPKE
jgi:hypothetical protein